MKTLLATSFLLLASATSSLAEVLDVDVQFGPYFQVRDAVQAAAPGDLIRVHAGTYEYFGLFGKPLAIVAVEPGVVIAGTVRVQGIDPGEVVQLYGLEVTPIDGAGLIAVDCPGSLRIADCVIQNAITYGSQTDWLSTGIRVERCDDIAFSRCQASDADPLAALGATAMCHVSDSTVAFNDCELIAWHADLCTDSTGGDGIKLVRSTALLQHTTVSGGRGAAIDEDFCPPFTTNYCGNGGHAVAAVDSSVVILDCALQPGSGAWVGGFQGCQGSNGLRILSTGSNVLEDSSTAPRLGVDRAIAVEGSTLQFEADGAAGDLVYLIASPAAHTVVLPGVTGHLLIQAPNGGRRAFAGSIPSAGALQWSWTAPMLPPNMHLSLHVQSGHVRNGALLLGPVQLVHVLDSSL